MSVCIEFELEIFSLLVSESLTAECSCALMWLLVAEPCGDCCCCQLNLLTNTLSQTYVPSHTYSTSMHIQKHIRRTVYRHGLTFSCKRSSQKSRQFVLSSSHKNRWGHTEVPRAVSHMHTYSMHIANESTESCSYSIYEHKSILTHMPAVNIQLHSGRFKIWHLRFPPIWLFIQTKTDISPLPLKGISCHKCHTSLLIHISV